jgi:hypothetical protein
MAEEQREPITFSAFVLSLATTAAVHFGDLGDPEGGEKEEPNLEAAAQMIDILALLQEKTRGNLEPEEDRLLGQVLYELRLRFVEVRDTHQPKRIIIP